MRVRTSFLIVSALTLAVAFVHAQVTDPITAPVEKRGLMVEIRNVDERQNTIRQELSLALTAIVTQWLVPKVGGGRVPAVEVLRVGYGARQHIRKNALQHLHQEITITRKHGSITLEESLARLFKAGSITRADAVERSSHQDEIDALLG